MGYRNILAGVIACFMLTDIGFAMDQPLKLQEEQSNFKTRDSGVIAIRLANQYLKASSNEERIDSIKTLCNHLASLDNNNIFRVASIEIAHEGDINWISTFCNLQTDDKIHQGLLQKFKAHVYKTYFEREGKKPLCALLKELAQELQQEIKNREKKSKEQKCGNEDIVKSLELLTKVLPERKNKIDTVMKYLMQYPIDVNELSDVFKKLCEKEKSPGEKALLVAEDSSLPIEDKKRKLIALKAQQLGFPFPTMDAFGNPITEPFARSLSPEAIEMLYLIKSEMPKTELLQLLWLEDENALKRAEKRILKEKRVLDPHSKDLDKHERIFKKAFDEIPQLNVKKSPAKISEHLQRLFKVKNYIANRLQFEGFNTLERKELLQKYQNRLHADAQKVIEYLLAENMSIEEALKYFGDKQLKEYHEDFLWKKFEMMFPKDLALDADYFEKFDTFLNSLQNSDISEFRRYKQILDERAKVAIAGAVGATPELSQKNYFRETEFLKPYWERNNFINILNRNMYVPDQRENNIKILSSIYNELFEFMQQPELLKQYGSVVHSIADKIKFLRDLLTFKSDLDKVESYSNESYEALGDDMFIVDLLNISNGIDYANKIDLEQIRQLGENPVLKEFFQNRFNIIEYDKKVKIVKACEKIHDKIKEFPLPSIQQEENIEKILEQSIVELPIEPPAVPAGQLPHHPEGIPLRVLLEMGRRAVPQAQQQAIQPPIVPQQAPQPEEPSFFARISIALSEFVNTISAGFSRIWRILVGG